MPFTRRTVRTRRCSDHPTNLGFFYDPAIALSGRRQQVHQRLRDLAVGGLDVESFWRAAEQELSEVLDFDWRPCWFTLDPSSLVWTSHFNPEIEQLDAEVFRNEYVEEDFNKMAELGASGIDVTTLDRATGGDLRRSRRFRDLLSAYGLGHELVAMLRTGQTCWASVTLYRTDDKPDFADDDLKFIRHIGPALAEGARRGLLVGEAHDSTLTIGDAPAVVVIDRELQPVSMTFSAGGWLERLGGARDRMPDVVRAIGAAASQRNGAIGQPQFARLRTRTGSWVFVHASPMANDPDLIAVIIAAASPDRLGPLLMDAYGLTEREQAITQQVLQGASTSDIGAALHLSPYTVQDHLKSIFDKSGVRSRRQLLATVFFDHFEPRVRDNERRVSQGHRIRGGPLPRAHLGDNGEPP